jgi:hypothetical protein
MLTVIPVAQDVGEQKGERNRKKKKEVNIETVNYALNMLFLCSGINQYIKTEAEHLYESETLCCYILSSI